MKLLVWITCLFLALPAAKAQNIVHRVSVIISYVLSVDLDDGEPTGTQIQGLDRVTNIFYRRVLSSSFSPQYEDVVLDSSSFSVIDHCTVSVTFDFTITYNRKNGATPTLDETTNAMTSSGFNVNNYIGTYVRNAGPADNVFQYTDTVAIAIGSASAPTPSGGKPDSGSSSGGGGSAPPRASACFSGENLVEVLAQNQGHESVFHHVRMEDLRVGDSVHVGRGTYSAVYGFGHLDKENEYQYWRVHTRPGHLGEPKHQPFELSDEHLVFVDGYADPVRADQLEVGQILHGPIALRPYVVTKLERVTRIGAYLPLTPEGTIVVNGIEASTYVSAHDNGYSWWLTSIVSEHDLFGWFVSPFRLMCSTLGMTQICSHPSMYEEESGVWHWLLLGQKLANTWDNVHDWQILLLVFIGMAFYLKVSIRMVQNKLKHS